METASDSMLNEEFRRKEKSTNFQYEANVIDKRERGETRGRNKSKAKGYSQSRTRTIMC